MDIAWESLKGWSRTKDSYFLATSPIHREYKLKMTKEQVIEQSVEAVKYAAASFLMFNGLLKMQAEQNYIS